MYTLINKKGHLLRVICREVLFLICDKVFFKGNYSIFLLTTIVFCYIRNLR